MITSDPIINSFREVPQKSSKGIPAELNENLRKPSPATNYLSWIESVQEEYFGKGATRVTEVPDSDGKVGEWNNFWLNYNSTRSKYLSSTYGHTEVRNKEAQEYVTLSLEEIRETLRCCKKITEILENVLIRNDRECNNIYNIGSSLHSDPVLSHQVTIHLYIYLL
nr:unnamed protein product [Callosobruchus analis]